MSQAHQRTFLRRTRLAAILATGALGLSACGLVENSGETASLSGGAESSDSSVRATANNQDTKGTKDTMAATIGSGQTAAAASAGVAPLGSADTAMKTARPEAPSQMLVTAVRVGSHENFDRVVFELAGQGTPGWFIDYTTSPTQQGSGHSVAYSGAIALNVNIDGTSYPFELNREDPNIGTVSGAGNVTEVISQGTFEGRSQFIVGLKSTLPYSVQLISDPQRLVIDIAH